MIEHLALPLLRWFDGRFRTARSRIAGWTGLGFVLGGGIGLCDPYVTPALVIACAGALGTVAFMLVAGLTAIHAHRRRVVSRYGTLPWLLMPTMLAMYATLMFAIVGFVLACFAFERFF